MEYSDKIDFYLHYAILSEKDAMSCKAAEIILEQREINILSSIARSRTSLGIDLAERAKIILAAADGLSNLQVVERENVEKHRVALWRNRWKQQYNQWKQLDEKLRPSMSKELIVSWLKDHSGRGRKATITTEQKALIIAVTCPNENGQKKNHSHARLT